MKHKQAIQITGSLTTPPIDVGQLAAHSVWKAPASDMLVNALLGMHAAAADRYPGMNTEWIVKEQECARAFNFELPVDLAQAADSLEAAIRAIMDVEQCVVLIFEEQSGAYINLQDMARNTLKSPEARQLSDDLLSHCLSTPESQLISSQLSLEGTLIGLVAVAVKTDGSTLELKDQCLLDMMAPYLAYKIHRFMQLKQSQTLPYMQGIALELAGRLVTAVDQEGIITALLEIFTVRLGFDACQYVNFNSETGEGEVLYDIRKPSTPGSTAKVHSYSHAGLESKRRRIREFSNLVGLLSSLARNRFYLHLNSRKLGERTLGDIFGVRNIQSALLLPVIDVATGKIQGTFNLFLTTSTHISEECRDIAIEAVQMASQAFNRAQVLEKALAMASSDELTGLINRRGYYQRFESELERARRHQTPLCVALVDVDHFKRLNDQYGHLSGDLVLKALAELFTQNTRKSDVLCRFGGEEFAILLPDTGLSAAVELMERVRQSVERMTLHDFNGEVLRATISVGVAEVDTKPKVSAHRSEISEALALADEELYRAKNSGRNQVCYRKAKAKKVPQAG